jgi:NADPH-dependent F420 reductase
MKIAIIGTGNVGSALARGWAGKGHELTLGSRDPAKVAGLAAEVAAKVASPAEAAKGAEVVVLALPWPKAEEAVKALGDLSGKVVIDCMNPLGMVNGGLGLMLGYTVSAAEMVQGWLPGGKVVKSLNQVGAEVMQHARRMAHKPVQFVAGDDEGAKAQVMALLADLGFDPMDAGGLHQARILEPFAMVWINQSFARGKGRAWGFAAVDLP